jgi:hypothetical protein
VNVQEIRQLDTYLHKLFGNNAIRVVPRPEEPDMADVFVGNDSLGELNVDEDEGERSYNLRTVIQLSKDADVQPVPLLTTQLRARFGSDKIRVVPRTKKTDSMEVYLGEEFIGVLFVEDEKGRRSYIFELPILDVDLVEG